jgi:single-stranded-DNA-specific exonuclease
VVTVDCGAMAYDAIAAAGEIGLEVVVIDHHMMREDPPAAAAVVNPEPTGLRLGVRGIWPRPGSPSFCSRR